MVYLVQQQKELHESLSLCFKAGLVPLSKFTLDQSFPSVWMISNMEG